MVTGESAGLPVFGCRFCSPQFDNPNRASRIGEGPEPAIGSLDFLEISLKRAGQSEDTHRAPAGGNSPYVDQRGRVGDHLAKRGQQRTQLLLQGIGRRTQGGTARSGEGCGIETHADSVTAQIVLTNDGLVVDVTSELISEAVDGGTDVVDRFRQCDQRRMVCWQSQVPTASCCQAAPPTRVVQGTQLAAKDALFGPLLQGQGRCFFECMGLVANDPSGEGLVVGVSGGLSFGVAQEQVEQQGVVDNDYVGPLSVLPRPAVEIGLSGRRWTVVAARTDAG